MPSVMGYLNEPTQQKLEKLHFYYLAKPFHDQLGAKGLDKRDHVFIAEQWMPRKHPF